MTSKNLSIVFLIVTFSICIYAYRNYISTNNIKGTYVSVNYSKEATVAEISGSQDTLMLLSNGDCKSIFWGNGSYEINHTFAGTTIRLRFNYELGKSEFETGVQRFNINKIKIKLDRDRDQYYEKIK